MRLQAVFFDMGGTIQTFRFDREMRVKNAGILRDCLTRNGIHLELNDEQFADSFSKGISSYQKWSRKSLIELPTLDVWTDYVFKDFPIKRETLAPLAEELAYLYETWFYYREMRPEIPQVLLKIRKMGLKIGCISNVLSHNRVPDYLKEYGILEYFDLIVLSSDYGIRKPDPAIFYHAARLANLPTGACVCVGDKVTRDIIGAQHSGFRSAVQIRHDFDDGDLDEGATPDAVIDNMNELLPLLDNEISKGIRSEAAVEGRRIKGLFFDAGKILYHRPHKGQHLKEFLAKNNGVPHPNIIRERTKLKDQAFKGELDLDEYYEKLIRLYGFTDPKLIDEGIKAIVLDRTTVEIFDGVPETLKALKEKGFILGIITDTATPIHVKLDWFEKAGFGKVWDAIISSNEIGVRKNAPVIFEEAYIGTGLTAQESIFIGHKAFELNSAHSVGMTTIAFNNTDRAVADFYIKKFSDLLTIPLIQDISRNRSGG